MVPVTVDRAYSLLAIKSLDARRRTFSGMASTPELDRQGDSLDPAGATFAASIPLLFHHDAKQPIGRVTLTRTPQGIAFDAELPEIDEPGPLKARVDEAWQSIKAGLISGVSIGHRILAGGVEYLRDGTRKLTKTEICELSLVTIPANASASIRLVKSLAQGDVMPLTAAEHITTLEQKRQTLADSMAGLMDTAAKENRHLSDDESAQHARFAADAEQCATTIAQWKDTEALQIKTATPVRRIVSPYAHVSVMPNVEKGTQFIRYVCAQAIAHKTHVPAYEIAARWNDSTPEVALALKAAVAAGTATDATWAGPLVQPNISKDFIELLRAATIVDQISGLYRVPFNAKIPQQTGGGTYGWVGELKPKPVTSLTFGSVTLDWAKVAAIIVLSQELIKLSSPSAEDVVRREMVAGIARFIDAQFTDPAIAAVAGVNPASITNGAPTAAATANPWADILGLVNHFTTNNIPIGGLTFIMSPANALALSFKTFADGTAQFPGVNVDGGTWKGMKFIVSNTVTTKVIALQPSLILYADDGGVTIDASGEASLQMDGAPDSPVAATTILVSMFQMNAVALRAERFTNWKKINANAVKYLTAAAWPAPTGFERDASAGE
jgi:HK97 family phage major capsid protein/HK97 family phage prohead protease